MVFPMWVLARYEVASYNKSAFPSTFSSIWPLNTLAYVPMHNTLPIVFVLQAKLV